MLSILIPTYNHDCTSFIQALKKQADNLIHPYEIIVIDDASKEKYKIKNGIIKDWENCIYSENKTNIGRAAIRNKLAQKAKYEWLLFMDCDGTVISEKFLSNYIEARIKADVIVGGISLPFKEPSPKLSLRYQYERAGEKKLTPTYRNKHPYEKFNTFNFLIRKSAFEKIRFNEKLVKYGHEDTLFGKDLKLKAISIFHINNPLGRFDLEENEIFLRKTRLSIETLVEHQDQLKNISSLYLAYQKLEQFHIAAIIYYIVHFFRPLVIHNLKGRKPDLFLFSTYKLYYLHKTITKK